MEGAAGFWSAPPNSGELLTGQDSSSDKEFEAYRTAVGKIAFPDKSKADALASKLPDYKYIVEWVYDKDNWARSFLQIHQRIGLNTKEGTAFSIAFENDKGQPPAKVMPRPGAITLYVNLPVLHAEATKFPSIGVNGVLTHELTHVMQFARGGNAPKGWPTWLVEGMATYVSAVEDKYIAGWAQKEPPHSLDEPIKDVIDAPYAWGNLFLSFVETRYGKKNLDQFIDLLINQKKNFKTAAEEATRKKWGDLVQEELEWKKAWIKNVIQKNKEKKK